MSIKSARKLGFWGALAMLIGSVVGIGIFFKNGSVLKASEGNGTTLLLTWIIGGILALFAAISFSEIGSQKTKNVHGLSAWAETSSGKKFGYFVRSNYAFLYYTLLTPILAFFTAEIFFQFLNVADGITMPSIWVIAIVAAPLAIFVISINQFSIKASGIVQLVTTCLKVIPLVLVILIGLSLVGTHNAGGSNHFTNGTNFTFTGLLAGLPAVLFAYDAFLDVGALSSKTKGEQKTVSKVIFIGLLSVIIIYTLIALSSIFHGITTTKPNGDLKYDGSIQSILADSLPPSAQKGIGIFVWLFLTFSAYGVLNGVTAGGAANIRQAIITRSLFGTSTFLKKWGYINTKNFYSILLIGIGIIINYVPALILNDDAFVDGLSNLPTLFFFGIYATTIFNYWRKRKSFDTKKANNKLFNIGAWIAIIGTLFIVGYQLFYGFTIKAFIDPNHANSAGFLLAKGLTDLQFFWIFLAYGIVFGTLPFLNLLLIRRVEKFDPIFDTQNAKLLDSENQLIIY